MRRHRCQQCQQMFTGKAGRKYCSMRCSAKSRPPGFHQQIGHKGGVIRAEHLRPGVSAKYRELSQGLTPWDAFRAGARWQRRRMTSTAYARGLRKGYADGLEDGWDQAKRQYAPFRDRPRVA